MRVREVGTKQWIECLDESCPARTCFAPAPWQVRGAAGSGSRSTGATRWCCVRREAHGCPSPLPLPDWSRVEGGRKAWHREGGG